jgi:hypothetical protein
MSRTGLLWLVVLSLVAIFVAYLTSIEQNDRRRKLHSSYNPSNICASAFDQNLDFSNLQENRLTIELTEGCFGGWVHLPRSWNFWHTQPAVYTQGFWYAFWFANDPHSIGPFSPNDTRTLNVNVHDLFRLQGHGTIMFYNNTPGEAHETPANIIVKPPPDEPKADTNAPLTAVYAKRFCTDHPADDHSHPDADDFMIDLAEGCFAGPYRIPAWWKSIQWEKSKANDDWAAVWCEGSSEPSAIHPYYESFAEGDLPPRCRTFYLQGKGSIHFTVLATGRPAKHPVYH